MIAGAFTIVFTVALPLLVVPACLEHLVRLSERFEVIVSHDTADRQIDR